MCISWGRKETSLGWAFAMSFYRFCHGINLLKLNWRVESWNYKSWWRVHHQGKNSVTLYIANFLSLSPLRPISQKIILPVSSRYAQSHQLSSPLWLSLWSMYHLLSPGSEEPATWSADLVGSLTWAESSNVPPHPAPNKRLNSSCGPPSPYPHFSSFLLTHLLLSLITAAFCHWPPVPRAASSMEWMHDKYLLNEQVNGN